MTKLYESKFSLKPGRYVYVPSDEGRVRSEEIVRTLQPFAPNSPLLYHLGKAGGHLAAVRAHQSLDFHCSIDLRNFFGTITRARIARRLSKLGVGSRDAYEIAFDSCVVEEGRKVLPYGFVQSMLLASIVLDGSRFVKSLEQLRYAGFILSMYVDDILISHSDIRLLDRAYQFLLEEVVNCGFEVATAKCSAPGGRVEAFNIGLENGRMEILGPRMEAFIESYQFASDAGREAIIRYVSVVNPEQARMLRL